ncbi:IS1249 family transposase [Corynebacterium incognita]|uniref:IS1249 family transposase n=1 Tax=Corynebacterium incognita TaxID=2754725 RepID=A0A7G7CP48_9CORY|nr:IS1249 family transposase [Corynebacterium incognita]QNE89364.1 IS1249 family transposase [Corynebacterium incognita]
MTTNRPRCPGCAGPMKKNGTTTAGTTRWRCTNPNCRQSHTRKRTDIHQATAFNDFYSYVTGHQTLADIAARRGVSRWTLDRRFRTFWYIDVPNTPDPHRIYDQVFIDGTYTSAGCLLIASTRSHVLCWQWATSESTYAYTQLLKHLAPPLCVVLDGGQGAYSAIKSCWPTTRIQRCLVHAQRVVRRYTTSRPRTPAGHTIYALALKLTQITNTEQAAEWVINLHEFGEVYKSFLNEKTPLPKERRTATRTWEYTHVRVRKAYNSLLHLSKQGYLFTYLEPSSESTDTSWASTTNSLEGGINSQLKLLARMHRGRSGERQRKMLEWWLNAKTQLPDDPLQIARQCNFGLDQLAKVTDLEPEDLNAADNETGRPALYDKAIGDEYQHNIGIRKGPLR